MSDLKFNEVNPRVIERDGQPITDGIDKTSSDQVAFLLDSDWAKSAFLINDSQLEYIDVINRYWSSASSKFTDTRLGANIGINSRPQFTRYSDIRVKGRLTDRKNTSVTNTSGNLGMGRYYSEAIDDPSQTVYLRFGVPQFNTLTNFLTKSFDSEQVTIARTGRASNVFYSLGKAAGTAAAVIAFPAISMAILAGKFLSFMFLRQTSKFYTMKPTMHLYWSTVNLLVNTIAINKGIYPKVARAPGDSSQKIGQPFSVDTGMLDEISNMMPDVFNDNRFFDMYALANKAQRLANLQAIAEFDRLDNGSASDFTGHVKKVLTGTDVVTSKGTTGAGAPTLAARINNILTFEKYFGTKGAEERMEMHPKLDPNKPKGDEIKDDGYFKQFVEHFDSEFRDGSQYAVFKVDSTGSVSESFANSVMESDLSQKLNQISSQSRQARFSFADGNIAGGMIGMAADAVGAVKDLALGALDGVTMGFSNIIAGLGGSGYIDIPKHWQSSQATLPRSSYTMQLISPYGNAFSQMQNIFIPLSMIMAGALPRSTGKASFTGPFLCQLFDKGRCQVQLGMVESLSVTRGTSNLPFNLRGEALAIDVTFSIVDLSSIMHMPVSSGSFLEVDMTLDEDNILSDYLAVLAAQDIYSQTYSLPRARLKAIKMQAGVQRKLSSPAWAASALHSSLTSGMLKYLTLGAGVAFEAAVAGTSTVSNNGNSGSPSNL